MIPEAAVEALEALPHGATARIPGSSIVLTMNREDMADPFFECSDGGWLRCNNVFAHFGVDYVDVEAAKVIPDEAVDAAAKFLHDIDCRSAVHSGHPADFECYDWRVEARELLEAAAPHLQELQWGVRDIVSLHIAGHPSEESARSIAEEHPQWYEVVSRPMPGLWTTK